MSGMSSSTGAMDVLVGLETSRALTKKISNFDVGTCDIKRSSPQFSQNQVSIACQYKSSSLM